MTEYGEANLGRLLDALRGSGYDVSDLKRGRLVDFSLYDLEREDSTPIRLGFSPLRRGLLGFGRWRARVALPESAGEEPDAETLDLVLGYESKFDTFVAWQPEAHPSPDEPAVVRVSTDSLSAAREYGVDVDLHLHGDAERGPEIVTVFRPDRVRDYIEAVSDLGSLRQQLVQGGAAAVPEVTRAAFRALGTEPPGERPEALGVISKAARPSEPCRPEREVGTGFATPNGAALAPTDPLSPGGRYLFWFKVGDPVPSSIETSRTEMPLELLPAEAELDVVLFGFDGELELNPDADLGGLRLDEEGIVHVCVAVEKPSSPDAELDGALFFPLRTPEREGNARLRCNVYCEGVLVQSRVVSAWVSATAAPHEAEPALSSTLEYSLSRSLHSGQLAKLPRADVSLMLNGDGEQHQFRLYAPGNDREPAIASSATLEASDLKRPIDYCRAGLRKASWGTEEEWREKIEPKYPEAGDPDRLADDLLDLAVRGRHAYAAIAGKLVENRRQKRALRSIRGSARVEIATASGRFVPAALLYDAPLLAGAATRRELSLCEDFVRAREAPGVPLEDCPCLVGECPNWERKTVVCPGGFWGYRHAIGWPVSLEDSDASGVLAYESSLRAAMGSAEDLDRVVQHHTDVEELLGKLDEAPDVKRLLELLAARGDQLVYLYCHGGESLGGVPFVRIGAPESPTLTAAELEELDLEDGSSLVFLNGCTTTAVSPESSFDLVDAFIQYGGALGVIGTEITVFEPMAAAFGLDFLRAFVEEGKTVGEAVRHARLAALKRANPLGLAYVPFVLGGLILEPLADEAGHRRQRSTGPASAG